MSVFLYVERESVLHRLHPVTKVVALVLAFAASLIFSHLIPALGATVLALLGLTWAGGLGNLRRAWKFLLVLFLMTTLLWSVFLRVGEKGGKAAWSVTVPLPKVAVSAPWREKPYELGGKGWNLVEASPATVAYGAAMGLRIVACLLFGLVFLSCTRTEDFALGLRALGAPQGVSVAVSLAFRLVPMLAVTARNVIDAQRARGVDPAAGNIVQRIRNYVPLVTPVLAYALRGADMTAMALESRGLGADPSRRTHYRAFATTMWDVLIVATLAALVIACIVTRVHGLGAIALGPPA
jgi:energy-coupling factor transport system permease protein